MLNIKMRPLSVCTLVAACGLATNASAIDWAAPVDGNWNVAANWSPADIPNASGEMATLGLSGAYMVSMTNSFSINALNISNADAILGLADDTLSLSGALNNNGLIIINDDGDTFQSRLAFGADMNITGSGTVLLNGIGQSNDAAIGASAGFTMFNGASHTIRGDGQLEGTVVNNGSILADVAGGPGLLITGQLSGPGTLRADQGTLLLNGGSTLSNTTFSTINGGTARVNSGTATLDNVTFSGNLSILGQGHFISLTGPMTNNGTITVNEDLSVFNAHLRFDSTASITGNGLVRLQSAGNPNDAQIIVSDGFTGTIGANQTVEGSGQLTGSGASGTLHNAGIINGNDPLNYLLLLGNHTGTGTYMAEGGFLGLGSGLIMNGGTLDSSFGGGIYTYSGTSTLSNITNNGVMGILGQGHFISLTGPFSNNGTITINVDGSVFNGHLRIDTDVSINGNGSIMMMSAGNVNDAQIIVSDTFTGIIGSGQTVEGAGQIVATSPSGTVHNAGIIKGTDPLTPLALFGNHTGSGTYRADDGTIGLGSGLVMNGGTFDSTGTGIVETFSGTSTISNIVNNGNMGIRGEGHFLSLVGPLTNNGNIALNTTDTVFNAHLDANADVLIDGNGTITMLASASTDDSVMRAMDTFELTIGSEQTVQGSGRVTGISSGIVHNDGVFVANDPDFPLEMYGNHTASGTYRGDNGVLGLMNNSILDGGTFESSGTGMVEAISGTSTISNITNSGTLGIRGSGAFIDMLTDLTNNGEIMINVNNDLFNAHLEAEADVAINGNGTIHMQAPTNIGDAQLRANGFALTVGSGQTISGSGSLQGTMTVNGTIDPSGAPFRRMDAGELTLTASSEFIADLGGLADGEFDRIDVANSSTMDLGGATVTVNLDPGYVPVFGDTWDIIDGGTIIGSFGTVNVPAAPTAQLYRVVEEPNRVFAVLTCQADFTGDNFLDVFDVFLFLDLFNDASPRADFTGDGVLDIFDVFLFLNFYNGGCTGI